MITLHFNEDNSVLLSMIQDVNSCTDTYSKIFQLTCYRDEVESLKKILDLLIEQQGDILDIERNE